jgi:hypothetical protein
MKKPIIINAFHGLGDIIFAIPIYRKLIAEGHTVIHPYIDEYGPIWKHWPEITWIPRDLLKINYDDRKEVETENYKIIPLRWAGNQGKVDPLCMRAKYTMMSMDYWDWRNVTWKRDAHAEEMLMQELGITYGEKYAVVNTTFRHNRSGKVNITPPEGMRVIQLKQIKGYTLLDWGRVFENAAEIHTVGTSINYILDPNFLQVHCPIHLYVRRPDEKDFANYNYLLKKDYVYHNG